MTKKIALALLIAVLGGGDSIVFSQNKSRKVDINELTRISKETGKYELPVYNHQDLILLKEKNKRHNRVGFYLKSSRFWILMAAIGGGVAGAVLAITQNTNTRTLPYPSAAMGPLKKN